MATERLVPRRTGFAPRLFRRMPPGVDLRDEVQLESILATADALLDRVDDPEELVALEWTLASEPGAWPLGAQLVVKLARSKALLGRRREPLHLSVVLPVYAEHERIQRACDHPLGEGFIDRKIRQLQWLLGGRPDRRYELLIVDDGCPHGSGEIAEEILRNRHPDAPARVVFLADAISARLPVVAPMRSTDESQKGGAVQLGLWLVTRARRQGHAVLYTDADLSTHLGQAGLLIDALDRPGIQVAAGSRRAPRSVVVKSTRRSARGRLFIHLWKQLLPELGYVEDSQCGFKALTGRAARRLVERPSERGFAFDLELLLRSERTAHRSIASVPVAWIDSESASTTKALEPYLPMLRSIVRLYRRHGSIRPEADALAHAIDQLDEAGWSAAVEALGPQLDGGRSQHSSVTPTALLGAAA